MDIFKYIENISNTIGFKIAQYFHEDNAGIEETQYGMFAILSFLFEFGTGILLSILFGYFKYFIIFQVTYCFLRSVCGGEHCDTFASCYVATNIVFIVGSVLSMLLSLNDVILSLSVIICFLCSVDMYHIIPKPSKNSPSRGENNLKFKNRYVKVTYWLIPVSSIFIILGIDFIPASICSAYMLCYVMLSRYGESFIKFFKF